MTGGTFSDVCGRFVDVSTKAALETLAEAAEAGDSFAEHFLTELDGATSGVSEEDRLAQCIATVTEARMCGGTDSAPGSSLVRVVSGVSFLAFYSRKFVMVEDASKRDGARAEIAKIRRVLSMVTPATVRRFLDTVLNLNGRLRRFGNPLWLTEQTEVAACVTPDDYIDRLALGERIEAPLFRFETGLNHIGSTPNLRRDRPDHDPTDAMQIRQPTAVDGLHYSGFRPGGLTAGGAKEYVSKLDNTDGVDRLTLIE